jgi:hypothetical protein
MNSRDPQREANEDKARIAVYAAAIKAAAAKHGVRADILAGIISRETRCHPRWVQPPPHGRLGDYGNGHGPGQIDRGSYAEWCKDWRAGLLTPEDGIDKAAEVLADKLVKVTALTAKMKKKPTPDELLRAACAAYNTGEVRASNCLIDGKDVDRYTTGRDYSADVLIRAKILGPIVGIV